MNIDVGRSILIIAVCALCTFGERIFPFAVFRNGKVPEVIRYLGKILPMSVIAALVVYCLRSTGFSAVEDFLPELAAVTATAALHLWKGNTLISVVGGTAVYMLFVQVIF